MDNIYFSYGPFEYPSLKSIDELCLETMPVKFDERDTSMISLSNAFYFQNMLVLHDLYV